MTGRDRGFRGFLGFTPPTREKKFYVTYSLGLKHGGSTGLEQPQTPETPN
jgi:hypothetical protein